MGSRWVSRGAFRPTAGVILGVAALLAATAPSGASQDEKAAPESGLAPEMVELIAAHNRERAAAHLKPLAANAKLEAAARLHARDMAEHAKLDHQGSDGSKFNERIERQGYRGRKMGENIAMGQKTVAEVLQSWMKSPPHRENILGQYSEIGVARATSAEGAPYWCVTFGLSWPKVDQGEATTGMVEALNRARAKAERPPLKPNPRLDAAAQALAQELASRGDLGGKAGRDETSPVDRVRQAGYSYLRLGEAAASGQTTADEVVKTWLDSPSHRENFLGDFSDIGVGFAHDDKGTPFWAVFLAKPAR